MNHIIELKINVCNRWWWCGGREHISIGDSMMSLMEKKIKMVNERIEIRTGVVRENTYQMRKKNTFCTVYDDELRVHLDLKQINVLFLCNGA